MKLTQDIVRSLLLYDPSSGIFTWLSPHKNAGKVAGSMGRRYLQINIESKSFYAHRLAWFYYHGQWPAHGLDHINGDRTDNRIQNLRDVPHRTNAENRLVAPKHSVTGLLGAYKRGKRFRGLIVVNGRSVHLGTFDTADLAHAAYIQAKRAFHPGCTI